MGTPLEPREEQVEEVLDRLYEEYPDSTISLNYSNRLELLIAVILRAVYRRAREQGVCGSVRDVRNARRLRERAPRGLAEAINSITYYNNKAKYIRSACADIAEQHDGEVPDTMSELTELAGVGQDRQRRAPARPRRRGGSSSTPTSSGSPAGSRSRKRRARRRSNRTSSTWFPRRTGSSSRIS